MRRVLHVATVAAHVWLVSELISEIHRLDESVADMRLRVGRLEGYVDRLKPATDYWWLKQR